MRTQKLQDQIDRNESRKCNAGGCIRTRKRVSAYCQYHERKRYRYGHPLGRAIVDREYQYEQEIIKTFMAQYADHPAIKAGIKWFNGWLGDASLSKPVPAQRDLWRLYDYGVKGETCLHAVLSLWLYSHLRPDRLPDDQRLTYGLALSIFTLAPRFKSYRWKKGVQVPHYIESASSAKQQAGKHIRETLGWLAHNVTTKVMDGMKQEDQLRNELSKEFK